MSAEAIVVDDVGTGVAGAPTLMRAAATELMGTAYLLIAVVGSGIMATRLTDDVALQLLANSAATAGGLAAIILALGPISGAHLNPAVTLLDALRKRTPAPRAAAYVVAQVVGAALGVVVANLMFDLDAVALSTTVRGGGGRVLGEVVATLGLLVLIESLVQTRRTHAVPWAVAAYIGGAYWFTSSTSFANPAVTVARTLTDTFAGIAPESVALFVLAQLVAIPLALLATRR